MNNWIYNDKEIISIEDLKKFEPGIWGFVYLLTLTDKKTKKIKYMYIGKKNIYSKRKKNFTKKQISAMTDKRGKKYEYIITESDWKNYCSSNKFIKSDGHKYNITREIIILSTNDMDLKWREAKEIICMGAMEDDLFLNNGVSIRKFKNFVT